MQTGAVLQLVLIGWVILTVIGILCALLERRRHRSNPSPAEDLSRRERELASKLQAEEQRKQAAADEAARVATHNARVDARTHVANFYNAHFDLLKDLYPPDLMQAFIYSEMTDLLEPLQLWKIAEEKIADLQKIVVVSKAQRAEEEPKKRKQALDERRRAAEVTACEMEIERLKIGDGDPDEIQKQQRRLRQLRDAADRVDVVTPTDL